MRRGLLSFRAVSLVGCALLVVTASIIIYARGFQTYSLKTSQCQFNPSGFFYVKGELPKGFEDFSHIALWKFASQVSRPIAGVYSKGGEVYQFTTLLADWSPERGYQVFEFATAQAKGISYTLTGKFLASCGYEFHVRDPAKVVAEGRLVKLRDGKKVADAALQFTYSSALRDKNTELIMAASNGDLPLVKAFLAQGADVGARALNGKTVLHFAVQSGNAALVKTLLAAGAQVNATASRPRGTGDDDDGKTAVLYAAEGTDVRVLEVLLAAGADAKAKDSRNRTALMYVAESSVEMVNVLLHAGVDINAKDIGGSTALMYAVPKGKAGIVEALIRGGADVNAKSGSGDTALMEAESGSPDVVKLLIAAKADVNAKTGSGYTALISAAVNDKPANVEALIRAGADVNAESEEGSALTYASSAEVARTLIRAGADTNARDSYGRTPLMHMAGYGFLESAKVLVSGGADVNAKDHNGVTVLMYAVQGEEQNHLDRASLKETGYRSPEMVKLLIAAGADMKAADNQGRTALSIAGSAKANEQIVSVLKQAGAR